MTYQRNLERNVPKEPRLGFEEDGWERASQERRERLYPSDFFYPTDFALEKVKRQVLGLKNADRQHLLAWLKEVLQTDEKKVPDAEIVEAAASSPREVVRRKLVGQTCYQLEYVKCGKQGCRCATGQGHGPYWYSYQRRNGRVTSEYIGRSAPAVVEL